MPSTFTMDPAAQYLSKWDSEAKRAIELETRIAADIHLYDAFADQTTKKKSSLVSLWSKEDLLNRLRSYADFWRLNPSEFFRLLAELLDVIVFDVLWIPGGNDQGTDIVAGS